MTGLQEMLGIRYPIIQGGMANIATGAFAAAFSDAASVVGGGALFPPAYSPFLLVAARPCPHAPAA